MSRDLIDRQKAIEALGEEPPVWFDGEGEIAERDQWRRDKTAIEAVPSAQPDRDIPRKPLEGCSLSWRQKVKEAGCPNCNFFLSHFRFYGEGKRITYCEHCGQAIDWEGWEWDE